jgi:hypothetical protein
MADFRFWSRDFWWARAAPAPAPEPPKKVPAPVLLLMDGQGGPMTLAHAREVLQRPSPGGKEIGASGTPRAGNVLGVDEYNRDLAGKNAIKVYDRMRRSDGQIRAVLDLLKLPLLGAEWNIIPPENGDATDEEIAAFCHSVLIDDDGMQESWEFVLRHILLMLDFGFSVLEKVWDIGPENRLVYHRLAPRLPVSIDKWEVDDETGALVTIVQRAVKGGQEKEIPIPAENCAVFVHNREGDNYNGISVLRPLYKHFHFKDTLYTIDAVGHERLSVGIPMAKLSDEADLSTPALDALEVVLGGIRNHERAFLIAMPGVEYDLLQTTTSNDSLMSSIEHHDVMIARGILAPFMNVGQAPHGTRSSTIELIDVYFNGLEGIAKTISGTAKVQLIKPLCDFNFPMEGRKYPTLVARNIRKIDPLVLADTLSKISSTGVLTTDDGIENAFREVMGYPPLDPKMSRELRPDAILPGTPNTVPAQRPTDTPGQGGATITGGPKRIAASAPRHYGYQQLREPNELEARVFALHLVPGVLDDAIARLVAEIGSIRQLQVDAAAKQLVAIDARSAAKRPFSELNPQTFGLLHQKDVERVIRRVQQMMVEFGSEQVRMEFRRQGMPIELSSGRLEDEMDAWTHHQFLLDVTVSGVIRPGSVRDQLAASARATAEQLNAQLRNTLMSEALRLRRSGLTGTELENAIKASAMASATKNIATSATGEVHEAFALGRAAEASRHKSDIAYVVQSSLLDATTCPNCSAVDGQIFAFESPEQIAHQPPYVQCRGRENCRCVQLYVYAGGGG